MKDDAALIEQYRKGDEAALGLLLERYEEPLFTYIYFNITDEDLANDIFQDTFIKIILCLKEDRYEDKGRFLGWAKCIARNLIIDYYRMRKRKNQISESDYDNEEFSIFDFIAEPEENIEEKLVAFQINENLHLMIGRLPDSQQEAIRLRFFKGLSFKEIAEEMDASINTTLGRVRYALINLRKMMEENKNILSSK